MITAVNRLGLYPDYSICTSTRVIENESNDYRTGEWIDLSHSIYTNVHDETTNVHKYLGYL